MKLLIGITLALIFYTLLKNQIKKHAVAFYLGTYAWIATVVLYYFLHIDQKFPVFITTYFVDIFQRGIFSTATFIIVMYLGVFIKHNKWSKNLMSIRGEMSIIGCIFVLCHNVIFGIVYFPTLFKTPELMSIQTKIASIITLILLALMLPLLITSFKCIRKKMKGKTWKNIQRLAYPFFLLIYVHVMVLYSANIELHKVDIAIYSLVYVAYIILRLRKYFIKRKASL